MKPLGVKAPVTIRSEAHRKAATRVNSPKHELIRIVADLRDAGANAKANRLESIVRRLEEWQRP